MKSLLRAQLSLLIALIVFLVISLWGIFFFDRSLEKKVRTTKEAAMTVALYERNRAEYDTQSAHFTNLKERITALQKLVITPDTVPGLLSELEARAALHGLVLEIQTVQTPIDTTKQKKLLIAFSASGTEPHIQDFFDDLHAQPFLMKILNFSLERNTTKTTEEWMAIATVEMVSFIAP